jgi:hypothetical protein
MKTRKKLKILALVLLGIGVFCAGYAYRSMRELIATLAKPQIQSDYSIRGAIENKVGPLPASATNLYYATIGFQDADTFIAFSIDKTECEKWLDRIISIKEGMSMELQRLPKRVAERGPGSWEARYREPRYKDGNWNLPADAQVVVYDDKKWTIVYFPGGRRLFICLWGY